MFDLFKNIFMKVCIKFIIAGIYNEIIINSAL
jgi:hypothetical protein